MRRSGPPTRWRARATTSYSRGPASCPATTSSACSKPSMPPRRGGACGRARAWPAAWREWAATQPNSMSHPLASCQLPDALDSAQAAALPLDLVTAALAVDLAHPPSGATVFVQGVSGAVGASDHPIRGRQRDAGGGHRVRAHARLRRIAGRTTWWTIGIRIGLRAFGIWCDGGADASIDHTGGPLVRTVTAPNGDGGAHRMERPVRARTHPTPHSAGSSRTSAGMRIRANGCARCHARRSTAGQVPEAPARSAEPHRRRQSSRPTVTTMPFTDVVDGPPRTGHARTRAQAGARDGRK